MTYKEWAEEYIESAETLKRKISLLKNEAEFAPAAKLRDLNNRISIMYGMYLDCMKTADILVKREGTAY